MARKKRNKIKGKVDFMTPLDITIFGGKDDPCFGKLHDASHPTCGNCGDSEICAIVTLQRMHAVRKKEEAKGNYKDLEEPNLELRTLDFVISNLLVKRPKGVSLALIYKKVFVYFSKHEKLEKSFVKKKVLEYVLRNNKLKRFKVEGKKYVKLK